MRGLLLLLSFILSFTANAAPLSIADAFHPGTILKMVMSPDTKYLATIVFNGTNYGLGLTDTETLNAKLIYNGARVREGYWYFHKAPRDVEWAGNDLLAVDFGIEAESLTLDGKKLKEIGQVVIGPAERGSLLLS